MFLPVIFSLFLHPFMPVVIVRKFIKMGERDLTRYDRIIIRYIRLRVPFAVLQLNVHAPAELFDIELIPLDAQKIPDLFGLLNGGDTLFGHIYRKRR